MLYDMDMYYTPMKGRSVTQEIVRLHQHVNHVARCSTFRNVISSYRFLLLTFKQTADSKPRSTRTAGPKHSSKGPQRKSLPLNNDDGDEIAGPPPQGGEDAKDLSLYDFLEEASPAPQRFSGGGLSTRRSTVPWKEEPFQQSSYKGGQDLDALGEPFDADQQAIKKEILPTYLEVSDAGGCGVGEKDVDQKTVAALKDRGIEIFTPVQVLCCAVLQTLVYLDWDRQKMDRGDDLRVAST